jgi:DNA-directed RNA polymerase subunit K/omega
MLMTFDSSTIGRFELARLASLRAAQLMRGCVPFLPASHKRTTTARREVLAGLVLGLPRKIA